MGEKTAAIIGATGLTGGYLLDLLLADNSFSTIRVLVRKPLAKTNPRMEVKLVDFRDAESFKLALEGVDSIFCCIGTTTKKVKGNKELYRAIDYTIPVNAANFGKETGCETFAVMSSLGADSRSGNFYLRLKGEMEQSLKNIYMHSMHIFRPSLLLGDRKEFRLGEKIAKVFMKPLSFLFPAKYKPIHAGKVAKAMLEVTKEDRQGFFIYENKDIELKVKR